MKMEAHYRNTNCVERFRYWNLSMGHWRSLNDGYSDHERGI